MVVKSELLIRRAKTPGETVFMAELAVRAWQTAARHHIEVTDESRAALHTKFLCDINENADGILVAERQGQVCGWGARIPKSNYISDLWIDPAYHGQGLGGLLLNALMAQILLESFAEAEIGTHADNLPAIGLYRKAGFAVYWQEEEWSESFGRRVEKVRMKVGL
ncbi:GNAT family N-acetyltransferase [Ochrobactrum quorumnocens]|jgi:ribosomal-protein-alanine N-acetyltransferase|uniref:GNAT family N-acetyltransferase n=2 Tax=Brucella/Ochrobactrum group TaxID=2826938 RepID=A0A5N1K0B9_9HYPH|nr:GNAT family N-acetyltransferase [[Ochrobactrum] quorumnocens]MDH7790647.1 ribosomal-protein-alanine N-acetyltransferase [Ochrobactrum sp. AN78]